MNIKTQQEFFSELNERARAMGLETAVTKGAGAPQVGDTLRIAVPATDEGGQVLMEILALTMENDTDMIQFYTTMLLEIGPGYQALSQVLNQWNFYCPVGVFGIFEEGRQLFHKYSVLLHGGETPQELIDKVMDTWSVLYDVITAYYPEAIRLSEG